MFAGWLSLPHQITTLSFRNEVRNLKRYATDRLYKISPRTLPTGRRARRNDTKQKITKIISIIKNNYYIC